MLEKIKNVIFYNFWHNGDLFINRNYVKDIMNQLPWAKFFYAHKTHPNNTLDLCEYIPLEKVHPRANTTLKYFYDETSDSLYINTWVGCYIGEFIPKDAHSNLYLLYKIWSSFYKIFGFKLNNDFYNYLPTVDYSKFDLSSADRYLQSINHSDIVLICNNQQQSKQSSVGYMNRVILELSNIFKDKSFLVTAKLNIENPNVVYTDDLFGSSTGNLNQISYLSTKSKFIIGKNSGPFTYSHVRENILDHNKFLISFSHKKHECLLGDYQFNCNSYWSPKILDNEIIDICSQLLLNNSINNEISGIKNI
jgi:hypothetical protein